jgi:hypothetical protein
VAELAYAIALGAIGETLEGSNPSARIENEKTKKKHGTIPVDYF